MERAVADAGLAADMAIVPARPVETVKLLISEKSQ